MAVAFAIVTHGKLNNFIRECLNIWEGRNLDQRILCLRAFLELFSCQDVYNVYNLRMRQRFGALWSCYQLESGKTLRWSAFLSNKVFFFLSQAHQKKKKRMWSSFQLVKKDYTSILPNPPPIGMPAPTWSLIGDDPEIAELFEKKQMQSGYLN